MNWYDAFNAIEAGLWFLVSVVIPLRVPCGTCQQRCAVIMAAMAFIAFGITDLLEVGRIGTFPLWLWGMKIACGAAILAARYTWLGWQRFRWTDREMRFGIVCLIAVIGIIALQRWLDSLASAAT